MKLVFMGTPEFAVPSLRRLVMSGHQVLSVVTQPDRQSGRGRHVTEPPVKQYATSLGREVLQPATVNEPEFVYFLKGLAFDVLVVVAFGQILKRELLEAPRRDCLNVHASLLPKYRGAAPVHHAIIAGERCTGVSVMYMNARLDAGDILLQEAVTIEDWDTAGSLEKRLAETGAAALVRALDLMEQSQAPRRPQVETDATHAPMLTKESGRIDWEHSAEAIRNQVRGLDPWPGAFALLKGERLGIWRIERVPGSVMTCGRPGEMMGIHENGFAVQTGDGNALVTEVQSPGRRRMRAGEWLRGSGLRAGELLG